VYKVMMFMLPRLRWRDEQNVGRDVRSTSLL
jgi:hypothetical protein